MSQWAAWILAAALILAGVVWRSWPLVSSGAAVLGFPGIVPVPKSVTEPQDPTTERDTTMWRTRAERAADKEAEAGRRAGAPLVPPDDTQVHNNHAPAQTAAEEDAIRGGRGEHPTEEDE
jgi:hypothetical protein